MGNENYWNNSEARSKIAEAHTDDMQVRYKHQIEASAFGTERYGYPDHAPLRKTVEREYPDTEIVDMDSVSAIFAKKDGKTAVLNFASYKNPGGMFLKGSCAQEECLCHASYLYNVLSRYDATYYYSNKQDLNKSLYRNRALYTPNVFFEKFDQSGRSIAMCDVITCAAPNYFAAKKYCNVSREENRNALFSRIAFVRDIAEENNVETLILGAFGCGVFGQDPYEVAKIFFEMFYYSSVKKVVYAIPAGVNLDAFRNEWNTSYANRCVVSRTVKKENLYLVSCETGVVACVYVPTTVDRQTMEQALQAAKQEYWTKYSYGHLLPEVMCSLLHEELNNTKIPHRFVEFENIH